MEAQLVNKPTKGQEIKEQNTMLVFGSQNNFENAMRMAKALSSSTIVPKQYQGEGGYSNCIVALEIANRIGASPLMVMQNLYIVNGNPSWSSKFLVASLNSSGKFSPLRYEFDGEENTDKWKCRAYATDRMGEKLHGAWVSIEMAKKEGWYGKNGSKWQTIPQLMLQYRAAAFFQRLYAPEISMGMQTVEEVYDIIDADYEEISEKKSRFVVDKEVINQLDPAETEQPTQVAPQQQKQIKLEDL